MSFYFNVLKRGYFPKELPPGFQTDLFAIFARTVTGRALLKSYKPAERSTKPVVYVLALPGGRRRELTLCHPGSFAQLARKTADNLPKCLRLASNSPFSRSNLKRDNDYHRSLATRFLPGNVAREKAYSRGGARYTVVADINQFYPSLYTHAIGWALDHKMRTRAHYTGAGKTSFAGSIDTLFMSMQSRYSQGIPIGNDLSLLYSEIVLAKVDKALRLDRTTAFRWFDDFEISTETLEEAEAILTKLEKELDRFKLRLNPEKTRIEKLPECVEDSWHGKVRLAAKQLKLTTESILAYFDYVIRVSKQHPDKPVLNYAIGSVFKFDSPKFESLKLLQSMLTQCVLSEPNCTQKVFALLAYWKSKGATLDDKLIVRTIELMIERHKSRGLSNDVCWALSFCLEWQLSLGDKPSKILSEYFDDCISILTLDLAAKGLLSSKFNKRKIENVIDSSDLESEHWLLVYEATFHGWSTRGTAKVAADPLFSILKLKNVTFYNPTIPRYASIIKYGGAPQWVVKKLLAEGNAFIAQNQIDSMPPGPVSSSVERLLQAGLLTAFEDLEHDLPVDPYA